MISTARVSGLILFDFSFGQCVYVSFETNITNHLLSKNPGCWRTLFMAYLDTGVSAKGWCVTDHKTERNTRLTNVLHTWWGKVRHEEEHIGSGSHSKLKPPGQFPTSGLKILGGWSLPGPPVSKKSPPAQVVSWHWSHVADTAASFLR